MKSEKREDYYADIYDGSDFLLIPSPERYKFRLKSGSKKWVMQTNTKASKARRQCPEGWRFNVREKLVGELRLSKEQADYFKRSVTVQLDLLAGRDPVRVGKSVRELHNFILGLQVPLMEKLLTVTTGKRWVFTASHLVRKKKWRAPLPGNENIEVSITRGEDYVGSTFIQEKFEIEFQVPEEGLVSIDEFSTAVCSFMRGQGVTGDDLDPERNGAQHETLRRLAPFREVVLKAGS
jgi:hypothetical protein